MTDKDTQAHDLVRRKEWPKAFAVYDQILSPSTNNFKTPKERIMACLFGRSECGLETNKHDITISDCRRLLKMITDTDLNNTSARTRRRLIFSLYKLKRFAEAEQACKEWINSNCCPPSDVGKLLERYRTVIQMANGQKTNQRISQQRLDEEMIVIDEKLELWAISTLPTDRISKIINNCSSNTNNTKTIKIETNCSTTTTTTSTVINHSSNGGKNINSASSKKENNFQKQIDAIADGDSIVCSYCAITFADRSELRSHCQSEGHQNVIMSDEGKYFFFVNFFTDKFRHIISHVHKRFDSF